MLKVNYGGEAALERIKECHNEIILNKLNSKAGSSNNQGSAFGKHYSVNIKAKITASQVEIGESPKQA